MPPSKLMGPWAFHHRCGEGLRNLDDLRALLDRECCYMYLYCQAETVGLLFWVVFFVLFCFVFLRVEVVEQERQKKIRRFI